MYDHQARYPAIQSEVLQRLYTQTERQYVDALLAQEERVFEVTIRSQSVTLTVNIGDGMEVSQAVIEALSSRLTRLEHEMERHAIDTGENARSVFQQREQEEVARGQRQKADREEYARQQQGSVKGGQVA
jgi:translation elongation factor EF-Tu-like GTPase